MDVFRFGSAVKTNPRTTEIYGQVFILDAGETPFFTRLELTSLQDSIASYQVKIGVPGTGQLGICISSGKGHLIDTMNAPIDEIPWKYEVDSDEI